METERYEELNVVVKEDGQNMLSDDANADLRRMSIRCAREPLMNFWSTASRSRPRFSLDNREQAVLAESLLEYRFLSLVDRCVILEKT